MNLAQRTCVACEGGGNPLSSAQVKKYLQQISSWQLKNGKIQRDFAFKNFAQALKFINQVGEIAERQGHHPDIFLHGWNKVTLMLHTYALKGLSSNDFIMAAKINKLLHRGTKK